MSEPMQVLPLEYSTTGAAPAGRRLWLIAYGVWLVCLIATVLIVTTDVESVLITGPVIFIGAGTLMVMAIKRRSTPHVILGTLHCAICLLFFMLAAYFQMGPDEATRPFAVMGAVYTALSGVATLWCHLIELWRHT